MVDHQNLVDAIEARLLTVANIGQVHDRWRYSANWSDFLDQLKSTVTTDKIRAWQISVLEIESAPAVFGQNNRTYSLEVFGVHSFSDSQNSEAAFMALVELVLDALDFRTDLGVSNVIDYTVGPASARFENRMMGPVLCHSVTIRVPATIRKASTYA